jgi:hypothetical protein
LICISAAYELNYFSSSGLKQNETLCDKVSYCSDMSHRTTESNELTPRQPGKASAFCSILYHSRQTGFKYQTPMWLSESGEYFFWPKATTELNQSSAWDGILTCPSWLSNWSCQPTQKSLLLRMFLSSYYKLLYP